MDSTTLALINDIFTGSYVLLTLIIASVAIWSVRVNSKQSNDALEASQQQSKAAIDAVNMQIAASENQAKEALAAIYKQIEASREQAREALYNEHKPVIVPRTTPTTTNTTIFSMGLDNKGTGTALNTWGILAMTSPPIKYYFEHIAFLVPNIEALATFSGGEIQFPYDEFEGHSVYPKNNGNDMPSTFRLMVTYNDAFNNKYLVVFDCVYGLEWRQVDEVKKVKQRLDELVFRENPLAAWVQQKTGEAL